MATATRPGGLYYVNGRAVDANGEPIKGAPKQKPDTPRDQQPSAVPTGSPIEQFAQTLANAIKGKPATSKTQAEKTAAEPDEDELPTLDEMESHLAGLDLEAVKALQKRDDRKGAKALYEARIAELEAE